MVGSANTYSFLRGSIAHITRYGPPDGAARTSARRCPCGTSSLVPRGSATTRLRLAMPSQSPHWSAVRGAHSRPQVSAAWFAWAVEEERRLRSGRRHDCREPSELDEPCPRARQAGDRSRRKMETC